MPQLVESVGGGGTRGPSTSRAPLRARGYLVSGTRLIALLDAETVIGRGSGAGVCLRSRSVSASHARLSLSGDGLRASMTDVSRNGCAINGRLLRGASSALQSGDELRFGRAREAYIYWARNLLPHELTKVASSAGAPDDSVRDKVSSSDESCISDDDYHGSLGSGSSGGSLGSIGSIGIRNGVTGGCERSSAESAAAPPAMPSHRPPPPKAQTYAPRTMSALLATSAQGYARREYSGAGVAGALTMAKNDDNENCGNGMCSGGGVGSGTGTSSGIIGGLRGQLRVEASELPPAGRPSGSELASSLNHELSPTRWRQPTAVSSCPKNPKSSAAACTAPYRTAAGPRMLSTNGSKVAGTATSLAKNTYAGASKSNVRRETATSAAARLRSGGRWEEDFGDAAPPATTPAKVLVTRPARPPLPPQWLVAPAEMQVLASQAPHVPTSGNKEPAALSPKSKLSPRLHRAVDSALDEAQSHDDAASAFSVASACFSKDGTSGGGGGVVAHAPAERAQTQAPNLLASAVNPDSENAPAEFALSSRSLGDSSASPDDSRYGSLTAFLAAEERLAAERAHQQQLKSSQVPHLPPQQQASLNEPLGAHHSNSQLTPTTRTPAMCPSLDLVTTDEPPVLPEQDTKQGRQSSTLLADLLAASTPSLSLAHVATPPATPPKSPLLAPRAASPPHQPASPITPRVYVPPDVHPGKNLVSTSSVASHLLATPDAQANTVAESTATGGASTATSPAPSQPRAPPPVRQQPAKSSLSPAAEHRAGDEAKHSGGALAAWLLMAASAEFSSSSPPAANAIAARSWRLAALAVEASTASLRRTRGLH